MLETVCSLEQLVSAISRHERVGMVPGATRMVVAERELSVRRLV